jgi:hypothetical protein
MSGTAAESAIWSRLILWRPRLEFPLPVEWAGRTWVPLGELRPLLQAVSPVRDLSDIWRWVAQPLPTAEVEAALAVIARVEDRQSGANPGRPEYSLTLRIDDQVLRAVFMLTGPEGPTERIEMAEGQASWPAAPIPGAQAAMLAVAAALRRSCACWAAAL